MNFENNLLNRIDRENEKKIIGLDSIYRKISVDSEKFKIEINDPDFINHYGEEVIKKDNNLIEKYKKNYEVNEAKKIATILEEILLEQIELNNYFGENVNTIITSDYDDIINGIDGLIEFSKETYYFAYLGFAIDITFSNDLYTKMNKIKENIDKGCLAQVKYFKSEQNTDIIGEFPEIPRFIIGTDIKQVKELINLRFNPNIQSRNKKLSKHPIQFHILEQIILQAKTYLSYAQSKNNTKIEKKMTAILHIVNEIYDKKCIELENKQLFGDDKMFNNIKNVLEEKFGYNNVNKNKSF